ncbi:MAG: redox-regulated ATPase YchF [Candidatus Margulisbacteria bacterium]|nr:redox-regulated ATPase YchF [Candidatus Margulisiibacteriota bacterium]
MGFSLGIVGLPNVGKSTLFNALSRAKAEASNYPFCTIDPNIGVVEVPDERLIKLANLFASKKTIPTFIEFYDIAGLVKGAHQGEGLGNQFLSHIREVDAIAHVVRCFGGEEIAHVEGKVDPQFDIDIINYELEMAGIKKPVLYVANVDESGNPDQLRMVETIAAKESAKVVAISAKLESEIAELSDEDASAYLKTMGQEESALHKLIRTGYELLDLITFFTAGEKESRAWTIKKGTKAPQAAGKIHSDMERGFIAAEVINWHDLLTAGAYAKAREKGLIRTEGKNYIFQDGDVVVIRFNV